MSSAYGLTYPDTLAKVKAQISAIEKVRHSKVVHSWQSLDSRNKAKQLLMDIISRTSKLTDDKKKLQDFFLRFGITIEVDTLSEDDVAKLYRADEIIPEAAAIVSCCNNDDAYRLLDTIKQNFEQYAVLESKISTLRAESRFSDELDNFELLAALRDCRDAVVLSVPYSAWTTSKLEANMLLDQVMTIAGRLKKQRDQLLEICEESVFALDYVGMLNRFKAEYTSFFKIFKSSYKEDVKQVRLVFKEVRKKIPDDEIIALLQALRQYNEDLEQYRNLAAQVAKLLNVQEYDIWFDWKAVKKQLEAFNTVGNLFQDDFATYQFIIENRWSGIYDILTNYDELNTWFVGNDEAGKYYASLYLGIKTDTTKIRELLDHARTMCAIFASPDHYIEYMLSGKETQLIQKAQQYATAIVNARNWFAEKTTEIVEYTGVEYSEDFDTWKEILSQLEVFESIVTAVGESAGYAMVTRYSSDNALIDAYLEALVHITEISECAKAVYHTAAGKIDLNEIQIKCLIADVRTIISNASRLQSVYTVLSNYCPEGYSTLSISEIKADLAAVVLYQNTRDNLDEARIKLGEEYKGLDTNWEVVHSNIVFCNKVIQLLFGDVSPELIAAFVDETVLYSEAQVSELWQCYASARSVEATYPVFTKHKDLNEKIKLLADMIASLNEAIEIKNTITAVAYDKYCYSGIVEDLKKLGQVQEIQSAFNDGLVQVNKILPAFTFDGNTDWDYMAEIFNHLRQVKRGISSDSIDPEIMQFVTNGISGVPVTMYHSQIEKLMHNKHLVTDITSLFANKTILETYSLAKLTRRFRNCNDQFSTMDAWIDLRNCKKACVDNGLEDFIVTAQDTYYPPGTLKDVFLKSFYYEWFEKVCAGIESVSTFRVRTQESRVESFRELDAHRLTVDQIRIRERLIREMPDSHNFGRVTDEMSILLHELNKKRNIIPLRKLFRTIPNLLLKLKPCLMMSPLSVAYFLEAETYRFDMVIFDEASQILPQDAIGAIFRAKQVIIAGDSKQLPPTNFFSASTSNDADFDSDDEEGEEVNFDSILEEASNSLPNRSLLWHYRSRFEELISFSNQHIYQNNLITFPSSTIQETDTGVEYVYVKNGVYENKCNRAEAQEIVRMVAEHIRKHPDRSLGIIAFSESQQSVIEDEINKFRIRNPFNERFFGEDKDEPFFVKNLENVQGDERDTIIFSICYAKNAQGRMYRYFGPLGNQGGERRLNVAITRAKQNIKLVGSILPEDIDLSKTRSEGVRMLRSYISFAMQGSSALSKPEKKNSLYDVDTFSEQVGKFLISHGCTVKMNVGSSDYTIDIAVEHPKKPGHYIAGIECDGSSYYMARTVRDREHLRTAILEQMGWRMYRVWSTEWIRNPEAEKIRLMNFVSNALLHHREKTLDIQPSSGDVKEIVGTEVVKPDRTTKTQSSANPYNLPLYEEGKWWDRSTRRGKDRLSNIADMVHAVVKVEQPIHMELLYKRVGQGFTSGNTTQSVRCTIDQAIKECMQGEVVIEDRFIRLANLTSIQARRSRLGDPDRIIEYISIPEIAAAMEKILIGAYGMDRDVLCSEAAKVFGFERTGAKIKQRTNEAVDYLVRTRKVSDYDDKIQLLEG
ncbi:MAG: AAA domain-containing protein [Acutalibacteraceae bacterium]